MLLNAFVIVWLAGAMVVLGLALYRLAVAHFNEDDLLHLRDVDTAVVSHQASVSQRLDMVDRWGKALTIVVFSLGVVLAGTYLFQQWVETSKAAY